LIDSPFGLDGKVALVTGASRGLGAGIADALREAGATVVGTSRDPESAARAAERLGTPAVEMDVTDVASVRAGVDRVVSELGRLDILLNNAGVNVPQGVFDVDEESWDAVIDTNLKGSFFAAQAAARHMVERGEGGRIINIGSQAGVVGIEERSAYCASKGGVSLLTRVLAIELAPHGITANAVAPTFIATELTRATLEDPLAHPAGPRRRGGGRERGRGVSRQPRRGHGYRAHAAGGRRLDRVVRRFAEGMPSTNRAISHQHAQAFGFRFQPSASCALADS
jgi:2-deoxy-D-gluconate 3-dehydrogenase